MSTASAPLEIGRVSLTVHDLDKTSEFYESALGLAPMGRDGESARFGAGDRVLIELRQDKAARKSSRRDAGLFHTAFLLPRRGDLGAWLHHASADRIGLHGVADHLVSEALYLADPEGNGVEIYVDRPRAAWEVKAGLVRMSTDPLDLDDLMGSATAPWAAAPEGTVVGHVHLQTGALPQAQDFIVGELGFDVTSTYPGALFFGSGGYHHHLAGNIWNSRNAARRDFPATGLAAVEILDGTGRAATVLHDPWGTEFNITPKEA